MSKKLLQTTTVAALVGALVGSLMQGPSDSSNTAGVSSYEPALRARIADLEQENRKLANRLDLLENQPTTVQRNTDGPSREEFDALAASVHGLGLVQDESLQTPTGAGFDGAVSAVIEQRELAVQLEKQRLEEERRAERTQKRTDYWTEQLALDADQAERFNELLLARDQASAQLKADWQAGVANEILGENKVSIGVAFNTGLREVLTPQQLESYTTSVSSGESKK